MPPQALLPTSGGPRDFPGQSLCLCRQQPLDEFIFMIFSCHALKLWPALAASHGRAPSCNNTMCESTSPVWSHCLLLSLAVSKALTWMRLEDGLLAILRPPLSPLPLAGLKNSYPFSQDGNCSIPSTTPAPTAASSPCRG